MIINAKTGKIEIILKSPKGEEICFGNTLPYPKRADVFTMDRKQLLDLCTPKDSKIRNHVKEVSIRFKPDPVYIDVNSKEISIEQLYVMYKAAQKEINILDAALDAGVDKISDMTGGMSSELINRDDMAMGEKVKLHKESIRNDLLNRGEVAIKGGDKMR